MSIDNPQLGEKHYTSTVFVMTKESPQRVLLVHHKKFDKWMPPGGHQENMENSHEAAIRETKEETGVDITKYLPAPETIDSRAITIPSPDFILEERIDARGDQPEHYHLDMIYVVTVPYQTVTFQESESNNIGWFIREELEDLPMFDNVTIIIKKIMITAHEPLKV